MGDDIGEYYRGLLRGILERRDQSSYMVLAALKPCSYV